MIQSQVLIKDKKQQQDTLICIVIYCQNFFCVFMSVSSHVSIFSLFLVHFCMSQSKLLNL